jgi:hypothetical protein
MTIASILCAACVLSIMGARPTPLYAQWPGGPPQNSDAVTTTTVTNATGTIAQLNYQSDGALEGFLLGADILLDFPMNVAGGVGTLGVVGNSVTYSGTAVTGSSGFQTVRVSSFTNNTTKATYTNTTPTSTAYGPVSGTVKQLNYGEDGSIDAFVFTPGGSTSAILVVTGPQASTTLKPLLTVGGAVSVTGATMTNPMSSPCAATGALTVVEASSLTINGHTIVITGGAGGRGGHR